MVLFIVLRFEGPPNNGYVDYFATSSTRGLPFSTSSHPQQNVVGFVCCLGSRQRWHLMVVLGTIYSRDINVEQFSMYTLVICITSFEK